MKKLKRMASLLLVQVLLLSGISFCLAAQESQPEVQFTTREGEPDTAQLFESRREGWLQPGYAADASGKWCFTKEIVPSEETSGRIKVSMQLQQSGNAVSGEINTLFFENNNWKPGRKLIVRGQISDNLLSGELFDADGNVAGKHMFTFKKDSCEGIIRTIDERLFEIEAVRCR